MALIQCTKKLLDELTIGKAKIDFFKENHKNGLSLLGNWHANLIKFKRKNCVLFTHDQTLYSLFVPELIKSDFKEIEMVFRHHLNLNIMYEGLARYKPIFMEYKDSLTFTKSSSRSVLSSMSNMVELFHIWRLREPDLKNVDYLKINKFINKTPFAACGYSTPTERITAKLKEITASK